MPKEQSKFITKTREQLYEMFMNSLKEDTLPWEKPWRSGAEMNPLNPISGTKYHGVNRMLLWMISDMRGIEDGRWATFNQIADKNNKYHPGQKWHLNAGSKGVPVELWKIRKVGTKELIDFTEYEKIVRNDPDQISNYILYSQMFYLAFKMVMCNNCFENKENTYLYKKKPVGMNKKVLIGCVPAGR